MILILETEFQEDDADEEEGLLYDPTSVKKPENSGPHLQMNRICRPCWPAECFSLTCKFPTF